LRDRRAKHLVRLPQAARGPPAHLARRRVYRAPLLVAADDGHRAHIRIRGRRNRAATSRGDRTPARGRRASRYAVERRHRLCTGDGGDDVFLGCAPHRMLLRTSYIARALPSGLTPLWERVRGVLPTDGAGRRLRHLIDYTVGGLPAFLRANDSLARLLAGGL